MQRNTISTITEMIIILDTRFRRWVISIVANFACEIERVVLGPGWHPDNVG